MREERKVQHIENYLRSSYEGDGLFSNVFIEHDSLPGLSAEEIDPSANFLGRRISLPLIIDAMTGGVEISMEINRDLALLAKNFNIPMAVGSQTIALDGELSHMESFRVVRETVGAEGIVIANLNANASEEQVQRAIEMIDADAVQLHLNPAQELVMSEGDRDFKGVLENIRHLSGSIEKPIIVKEVGFGLSASAASRLWEAGVSYLDVSGHGGTNFVEIEDLRMGEFNFDDMYGWGNPTAYSVMKVREATPEAFLIGSGGIRTAMEAMKAVVLGADMVGMSGELLSYLMHGGLFQAERFLREFEYKFKALMLLTGSKDISALKKVPYRLTGRLRELME